MRMPILRGARLRGLVILLWASGTGFGICAVLTSASPAITDTYDDIEGRPVAWISDNSSSCRLGERMDVTATRRTKSSRLNHEHYGHDFVFPAPADVRMCVPQKNGNRNWGTLLHRLWFGYVPATIDDLLKKMSTYDKSIRSDSHRKNYDSVLLIARNPYTRILSQYLNHIAGSCVKGNLGCKKSSSQTFEEYIIEIYRKYEGKYRGNICLVDRHLCWQHSSCKSLHTKRSSPIILKLENQPLWWSCFLRLIEVDAQILEGKEWLVSSGQPCYYKPSDECGKTTASIDKVYVGPVHGTNATGRVLSFYTKKAAELVTKMYQNDLLLLNYPSWGGPPEPFHPV